MGKKFNDFLISEVWLWKQSLRPALARLLQYFWHGLLIAPRLTEYWRKDKRLHTTAADHDRLSGVHGDLTKELIGVSHEYQANQRTGYAVAGC
jgi:hypothetical protein